MKRSLRRLERIVALGTAGLSIAALALGCARTPPPRVPVPGPTNTDLVRERDPVRPLPSGAGEYDPRPFADEPILKQQLPGQGRFVDAYRRVGNPRIVVFVNRTLEGQLLPVNDDQPLVSVEHTRSSNAPVTVERRQNENTGGWRNDNRENTDRFESKGPGEYRERTDVYLRPGQYDEAWAKSLDYQAIENILTDWLSCDGQVEIVSPLMARGKLTDEQVKDLQSGKPRMLGEIARQLDAHILVQVQAHPTRQGPRGLDTRVVSEAISLKGGQSLGRAVVDITLPLEKTTINRFTRFLASKLMDGMASAWLSAGPASQDQAAPREALPPPAAPQGQSAPAPAPPAQPAPLPPPLVPAPTPPSVVPAPSVIPPPTQPAGPVGPRLNPSTVPPLPPPPVLPATQPGE